MVDLSEKSYYEILGVSFDASADEIKEAYRSIARAYHPDSNFYDEILESKNLKSHNPDQDKFKQITEAYNTLVNEERRKEYDKLFPKGLRDWEDVERATASKEDFRIIKESSHEDLVGTIYRPRKNTGTFTSSSFGSIVKEETEAMESAMEKALRGRSITPVDMPDEMNLIPWFVALLIGGFIAGGLLAYWLVTR